MNTEEGPLEMSFIFFLGHRGIQEVIIGFKVGLLK